MGSRSGRPRLRDRDAAHRGGSERRRARLGARSLPYEAVERPARFEHHRFVGDKRTQLVYDLDAWDDAAVVDEFVELGVGIGFAPDTLAEARNRGYTLATHGVWRAVRTPRS